MKSIISLATILTTAIALAVPGDLSKRGQFFGDMTHYNVAAGLTACGSTHANSELVVAINQPQYGYMANPNLAPICHQCVRIYGPHDTVVARIVDKCPECKRMDLDLSLATWEKAFGEGTEGRGRVKLSWDLISCQ